MSARWSLFGIAAGLTSALLYLLLTTGSPLALIFAYFSQTPLFMVGLGLGLTPALIACGVALIGLAAASEMLTVFLFLMLSVIPAIYILRQALWSRVGQDGQTEWYPPGPLLGGLTAYALVLFGLVVVFYGGAIEEVSRQYLEKLAQASGGALGPQAEILALYIPGAVLASALLMTVINATLAQGTLNRMGKAQRPSPQWSAVTLPRWLTPALAVAAVAAFLPDDIGVIGVNGAVITAMPFMLIGLAVLHTVSKRWPARGLALGLIYATTVILGWPAILVAGVGVVDQWLPLRRGRTV
jgi:hypothetical protein